jgi:NAD(P)-dependent dehydrogenase (short-subunit alcohol dehydrogenase family)
LTGFAKRVADGLSSAIAAGVVLLTKAVAIQYGARGIRCNAVVPGLVLTPAVKDVTPAQRAASNRLYPMPRLCEPNDVANAVLFLASDESGFVNATTLMVEGGASVYMPSISFTGQGECACVSSCRGSEHV